FRAIGRLSAAFRSSFMPVLNKLFLMLLLHSIVSEQISLAVCTSLQACKPLQNTPTTRHRLCQWQWGSSTKVHAGRPKALLSE
ncbi:Glycosyl hydrolase family protein 4, partial [Clarias magur]